METEYLIIGQGLCGTLMSWELTKLNREHIVIDSGLSITSSKIASGLINPITGQRFAKSWMYEDLVPVAIETYRELELALKKKFFSEIVFYDMFPDAGNASAFQKKQSQYPDLLSFAKEDEALDRYFNFELGIGKIAPCYLVDLPKLLSGYATKLKTDNKLVTSAIDTTQLKFASGKWHLGEISADRVIFCDGAAAVDSPFFKVLPFNLNKGEVVFVELEAPMPGGIFKNTLKLAPWHGLTYWVGTNFLWKFDDIEPSEQFRCHVEVELQKWLKVPFHIRDHVAAIRPATINRYPFVGEHPQHKGLFILNGMGAKACSQAPYFSKQLVNFIENSSTITREVDVQLSKNLLVN